MIKKSLLIIITFIVCNISLLAQEVIDEIVAVVGDEIILKSDIESQFIQMRSQGFVSETRDAKCDILEEMLFQKLLLNQARADSVVVSSSEVDQEINRRLGVFINQYGSEKELEEVYGKSVAEIRADFRTIIRDQLLTQRMQMKLVNDVSVTPGEVREFYNSIPKDSLPIIDAYVEYSELVIEPEISREERNKTIEKLENIRQRIMDGESFSTLAVLYSEDQGSAMNGGELGFVSREDLVPEFAAVAFNLQDKNTVSRVVQSEFGYHIIQLIERRGTLINVRHILLTPEIGDEQIAKAEDKITEIYNKIIADSISFTEAVRKYSDAETKFNEGVVANPYTGTRQIQRDFIERSTRRALARLRQGDVSAPFLATNAKGQRVLKIVKLNRRVDEHIANLEDDYQEIQEYAIQKKQQEYVFKWIESALERYYIRIDDSYINCEFNYADWKGENKSEK